MKVKYDIPYEIHMTFHMVEEIDTYIAEHN